MVMAWKDKEREKQYKKQWYENNREKILENKKEYNKEYYKNNREKMLEKNKEWSQTEAGKKSSRITKWKQLGVKHDDYDSLYEVYINTKFCEQCNIELVEGNFGANKKVLDHDHQTGLFRNVLCCGCNIRRG